MPDKLYSGIIEEKDNTFAMVIDVFEYFHKELEIYKSAAQGWKTFSKTLQSQIHNA